MAQINSELLFKRQALACEHKQDDDQDKEVRRVSWSSSESSALLFNRQAPACKNKQDVDQDAIDTTDQSSSASDDEVASSIGSASAHQQCEPSLMIPSDRKEGHELLWLKPSVGSRRAQLRGRGSDVLDIMSNDQDTTDEPQEVVEEVTKTQGPVVLLPPPPGLRPCDVACAQKEKLVLLPATPSLQKSAWRCTSAPSTSDSTECNIAEQWKQMFPANLEPRKVQCKANQYGATPCRNAMQDPSMPLKKRPIFQDTAPHIKKDAGVPTKKSISSFLLQSPPSVMAR